MRMWIRDSARKHVSRTCLIVTCTFVGFSGAYGADFTTLPLIGDGTFHAWEPRGISSDGSVVAGGDWNGGNYGYGAFRWTRTDGFLELDGFPGPFDWQRIAYDVSGDGGSIYGQARGTHPEQPEPVKWSIDGNISLLLDDYYLGAVAAVGASYDGSAVVGNNFYWRADSGIVDVAMGGGYYDISSDGSAFVGARASEGPSQPYLWTQNGDEATPLPTVNPPGTDNEWATVISADGQVIAGTTFPDFLALRWNGVADPEVLGNFTPAGISGDGSIIVGDGFVWRDGVGTVGVSDFLTDFGIDLMGWSNIQATAISADGFTIGGLGVNPLGQHQGWIATVPEPTAALLLLAGSAFLARRRGSWKSL